MSAPGASMQRCAFLFSHKRNYTFIVVLAKYYWVSMSLSEFLIPRNAHATKICGFEGIWKDICFEGK